MTKKTTNTGSKRRKTTKDVYAMWGNLKKIKEINKTTTTTGANTTTTLKRK